MARAAFRWVLTAVVSGGPGGDRRLQGLPGGFCWPWPENVHITPKVAGEMEKSRAIGKAELQDLIRYEDEWEWAI